MCEANINKDVIFLSVKKCESVCMCVLNSGFYLLEIIKNHVKKIRNTFSNLNKHLNFSLLI